MIICRSFFFMEIYLGLTFKINLLLVVCGQSQTLTNQEAQIVFTAGRHFPSGWPCCLHSTVYMIALVGYDQRPT